MSDLSQLGSRIQLRGKTLLDMFMSICIYTAQDNASVTENHCRFKEIMKRPITHIIYFSTFYFSFCSLFLLSSFSPSSYLSLLYLFHSLYLSYLLSILSLHLPTYPTIHHLYLYTCLHIYMSLYEQTTKTK